jgi:XPA protein C-terminus
MELTEEQRERIRRNRERALELQQEQKKRRSVTSSSSPGDISTNRGVEKRGTIQEESVSKTKRIKTNVQQDNNALGSSEDRHHNEKDVTTNGDVKDDRYKNDEIEAFEEGASEYVTKQEAMKVYCLPLGTLEVCSYVEKPNPKNNSWQTMKLYHRNEIRHRAHIRYGGIAGLLQERNKRNQLRLQKDIEKSKDIFKN